MVRTEKEIQRVNSKDFLTKCFDLLKNCIEPFEQFVPSWLRNPKENEDEIY